MQQENGKVLVDVGPCIPGKCGKAPQVLFQLGPPTRAGLRQLCPAGKQFSYSSLLDFGAVLRNSHHDQAISRSMCLYSPALPPQDPGF